VSGVYWHDITPIVVANASVIRVTAQVNQPPNNLYWHQQTGLFATPPVYCSSAVGSKDGAAAGTTGYGCHLMFQPGTAPTDWDVLAYGGAAAGGGSGVSEAPLDGTTYGRLNAQWNAVLPLSGGTMTGDLKFIDNLYDIGKLGATRPRNGYFSGTLQAPSIALTATALLQQSIGNGSLLFRESTQSRGITLDFNTDGMLKVFGRDGSTPAFATALAFEMPNNGYLGWTAGIVGGAIVQRIVREAQGLFGFEDVLAATKGFAIDVTTDATAKFRDRANSVDADVTFKTQTAGDNSTKGATTAFVTAAIASGASISVGTTPPVSPNPNQLWWQSELGVLFIYYNDGNSTQWVPCSPSTSTAISAQDQLVYLPATAINANTNLPIGSIGPLGAAGQKWEIEACCLMGSNQNNNTIVGLDIFDGTTSLAGGGGVVGFSTANWFIPQMVKAQKLLTGPTTFTIRGSGNAVGCVVTATGSGGPAGTASWVSARRLY
jgi:hypothetical protein